MESGSVVIAIFSIIIIGFAFWIIQKVTNI